MATFRELFGEKFSPDMPLSEAEKLFEGKRLADLSTGEYVSKAKYDEDTRRLAELTEAEGRRQAEIDEAVRKAVDAARREAKAAYDKQLEAERTAAGRKRAREKAYEGLNEEQRGLLDALLKEEDLTLAEDGETFSNFDELAKPIREKYRSLFPKDDGSHGKGGLPPESEKEGSGAAGDPFNFGFDSMQAQREKK